MDGGKTALLCRICNKPVGLTFDTAVDEDGKREVTTHQNGSHWESLYNDAIAELDPIKLLDKIAVAERAIGVRLEDALHGRNPIDANERQ